MTARIPPRAALVLACTMLASLGGPVRGVSAQAPLKIFISVDMEGIGGVGTGAMTGSSGKDYSTARRLMTDEVNEVVAAIFARGPAEIVVNDSHGDHQNVLHTELDPRVLYVQGAIKPLGMVSGLDDSYDGAVFLGYHAKAGDPAGFLAHTGTGSVKGLWLNDVEVGEAGMNAAFAGMLGVPVLLASGDSAFTAETRAYLDAETVTTKHAVTPAAARLLHPQVVRAALRAGTDRALDRLARGEIRAWTPGEEIRIRMRFDSTTHVEILQSI
ncbi:MAG TPA: M55 family metallopeptidase, partial [Longimicrobiales bacterium]|nr:M55 family metallopeptidase [Longimicrobiales bacterium]